MFNCADCASYYVMSSTKVTGIYLCSLRFPLSLILGTIHMVVYKIYSELVHYRGLVLYLGTLGIKSSEIILENTIDEKKLGINQ